MDWLFSVALRIIAATALIYFGLGLFNINWLMRIRAIAAIATGALLLGALAWPLVRPELPIAPVTLLGGSITIPAAVLCLILAFASGFIAYFVAWPAGRIFAPYAAPAGLAIWALAGGNMHRLLLDYYDLAQRQVLYAALRWEGFFWLLVCAAGYVGVVIASRLAGTKIVVLGNFNDGTNTTQNTNIAINFLLTMAATVFIGWFVLGIFAQDIYQPDPLLGTVIGQPGNRQIAFGVFATFCLASYLVKYALKVNYLPVAAASVFLTFAGATQLLRGETLAHLAGNWPIAYFNHAINAITPLQMVSFAVLGAITGHWMAVKFHHLTWKTH